MNQGRRTLIAVGGAIALAGPALGAGGAGVLLKVRGGGREVTFDRAALEALPQHHIVTATPWSAKPQKYSGPLMRDVLAKAALTGSGRELQATALNDYRVTIPVKDAIDHDVVIALLMDDKPMSVRDRGPLFVMYPFDRKPELRDAVHLSRCIWQLLALEVRP